MTTVVRTPYERITVGGQLLTQVVSWRTSNGADQRFATAEIVLPTLPDGLTENQAVSIVAGANRSTATTSFVGKLLDIKHTLAPLRVTLICRGPLFAAMAPCNNPGGTDLSNAMVGQTDQAMVEQILDAVGLTNRSIAGTGTVLGTIAGPSSFTWRENQAALSFIESLDEATRYSTFDTAGGTVTRALLNPVPRTSAAYTFTEGVDIYRADLEEDVFTTTNRVTVTGYSDGNGGALTWTVERADSYVDTPDGFRTFTLANTMIERQATGDAGDGLACEDVATQVIQEVDVVLQHFAFDTPLDYNIGIGTVIAVDAPNRLGSSGDTFWVQNVTRQRTERGGFSQHLICIGGKGSSAPITSPPIASFTINLVEQDPAIISGVESTIWVVYCEDTSTAQTGTIVGWAWSSSGTPSTGSESTYTVYYTSDPTGETISLTVTDSNGDTASVSQVIGDTIPASDQVVRKLYPANKQAEDWNGVTWRLYSDVNSIDVFSAANAPLWDAGKDAIASSTDLATTPTTTTPFGSGEEVSCEWVETNINPDLGLAGSNLGRVAVTNDAGHSWTVLSTVPDAEAILRVAINGDSPSQYFALTADHLYTSYAAGIPGSWVTLQTAGVGEAFVDLSLSWARSMIAIDGGRLMIEMTSGTTQTFPGSPSAIVAVTADIRKDRFYCVDSGGHTYYTTDDGGTAFTAGADLPAGSDVNARFIQRDGDIRELIYLALGTNGLWKSLDGFQTDGGYLQVRQPGLGSCPSTADYRQIGVDGNLTPVTDISGAVLLIATSSGLYKRIAPNLYVPTGLSGTNVLNIATSKGSDQTIYARHVTSGTMKFERSDDAGDTWTDLTSSVPMDISNTTPFDISCPDGDGTHVYMLGDDGSSGSNRGLWLSTNSGVSWSLVLAPFDQPAQPHGNNEKQVDVTDHDPSYVMNTEWLGALYNVWNPYSSASSQIDLLAASYAWLRSIRGTNTRALGGQYIASGQFLGLFDSADTNTLFNFSPNVPDSERAFAAAGASTTQFVALSTDAVANTVSLWGITLTGPLAITLGPGLNTAPAQVLLRKKRTSTLALAFPYSVDYDPQNKKHWFACWESATAEISTDGGVTWTTELTGIGTSDFHSMKVLSA